MNDPQAKAKRDKHYRYATKPEKVEAREIIAGLRLKKIRFEDEPLSKADIAKAFAEADAILSEGYVNLRMGVLRHPDLNGRDIQTASFLLHYARNDSKTRVSEATLAGELRCGLTAVKDSLKRLAAANLIQIDERSIGRSNEYHIAALRDPSLCVGVA